MSESSSHSSVAKEWRRHIYTSNCHDITRSALSCYLTSSKNFHGSRNMTNRHLVRWFLNFDLLITQELALLDLQNKDTLDIIFNTFWSRTFKFRVKFLGIDDLVNLKTASIASIDCNLHARLDITDTSDNTSEGYQVTDDLCLDISHFGNVLLGIFPRNDNDLILSLEFGRDHSLAIELLTFFDITSCCVSLDRIL